MRVIDELAQLLVRVIDVSPPTPSAPALRRIRRFGAVRLTVGVWIGIRICIRISVGVGVSIRISIRISVRIDFALGIRVAIGVSACVHSRPGSRGISTVGAGRGVFHIDVLVALRLDRIVNHNLVCRSWRHGSAVTVEIGRRVSIRTLLLLVTLSRPTCALCSAVRALVWIFLPAVCLAVALLGTTFSLGVAVRALAVSGATFPLTSGSVLVVVVVVSRMVLRIRGLFVRLLRLLGLFSLFDLVDLFSPLSLLGL